MVIDSMVLENLRNIETNMVQDFSFLVKNIHDLYIVLNVVYDFNQLNNKQNVFDLNIFCWGIVSNKGKVLGKNVVETVLNI